MATLFPPVPPEQQESVPLGLLVQFLKATSSTYLAYPVPALGQDTKGPGKRHQKLRLLPQRTSFCKAELPQRTSLCSLTCMEQELGYSSAQKVFIACSVTMRLRVSVVYPAQGRHPEVGWDTLEGHKEPAFQGFAYHSFMHTCSKY